MSPAGLAAGTLYRRLLIVTVLVGATVFFWGLGDIALMSFNEARRAIPASGMFHSGNWLLPYINGELYLSKPPLVYWLATVFAQIIGEANEWAVRLPSALAASLIAWASYRYARRAFGDWPALFTLQLLIANTGFAVFARRAEIEMLLTALCAGAFLAALHYIRGDGGRRWLIFSYFLLGLAVLTKGPLALLFVTLPLLAYAMYLRIPRAWDALRDPLGWVIFWVVGLSWYLAVTWQLGLDTWLAIVNKDMVGKIQSTSGEPFYNYLLWLLADFFPASLLLFVKPLATVKRWKQQSDCVALMLAIALPFVLYSLFSDKHAKYLLPLYPFISILLGKRLGELLERAGPGLRYGLLALGVALPLMYALFFSFAEARVFGYRISAFPQFTQWLRTAPPVPLYGYKDMDERLLYYAGREIPLMGEDELLVKRQEHASMLLLVEKDVEKIAQQADCEVKRFTPYLKKHRSLVVFGFGEVCTEVQPVELGK